ncbi:hypothetical protein ACN9MY_01120 [Pseudoduganella sp. R-31]|uniref:hypothetical protein n=1 Tax=unclassified Pseudoduganella TaxID=2637179 RepID=UPI003CF20CA4
MNQIIRCLPVLGALFLVACGGGGGGATTHTLAAAPRLADGTLAFEQLANVSYSGVQTPTTFVVRDSESMQKLWYSTYLNIFPVPDLPNVDFTRKMVLAVAWGYVDPCSSYAIDRVAISGGMVAVNYHLTPPLPTMMCAAVVTAPVQMIVVDRIDTTVNFIRN